MSALLRISGNDSALKQSLKTLVNSVAYFWTDPFRIFTGMSLETVALLFGRLLIIFTTSSSVKLEKEKISSAEL